MANIHRLEMKGRPRRLTPTGWRPAAPMMEWGKNPHGAWRPIFEGERKVEAEELRADIQRRLKLHQLHG